MQKMKVLVAGANGINGRALLSQLSQNGISARAMVRKRRRALDLESNTTEIIEGNLAKPESLKAAFKNVEKAFIVTPIQQDSTQLFNNFYETAKNAGVQHVIKLSGMGAAPDSKSTILRQHNQSDELLIQSGLNFTIIQPNSFFQNFLWQKKSIQLKSRFSVPLGSAKQSFVDVRDIAAATINIISDKKHLNKVYQLTGSESLSCYDIAEQLSELLGREIKYKPGSINRSKQEILASGAPEWNANSISEIYEEFSSGSYSHTTDQLKNIIGREPYHFYEFAKDHINEFSMPN
jgi:uncharacterized protein YbjT (DUF2867 family)